MNMDVLKETLLSDLRMLVGDKVDTISDIEFRPYSKTFYGKYLVNKQKVVIYPYETTDKLSPYSNILNTAIHEVCHHLQYSDPSFVRLKGVMHNVEFWNMYHTLVQKAEGLNLFERRLTNEEKCTV